MLANLRTGWEYLYKRGSRFAFPRMYQAARLLFSLPQHINVLRVLTHPQSAGLARQYPLLAFKYLADYVVLKLPMKSRRSIFLYHFQFLQRTYSTTFLDSVQRLSPILWRQTIEQKTFHVTMELLGVLGCEGELRLVFYMEGSEVYRLIFVFASGREFNLQDETIVIVSGIQGVPNFERVKVATKICCDIQPAHILMTAIGGLADAAGVSAILGPHDTRQLFCRPKLYFSYSSFFETYGKEIPNHKMYYISVPLPQKPVSEIKATHRRRNRQKRHFRAGVHCQVVQAIQEYLRSS